jgi:hypothetical protein
MRIALMMSVAGLLVGLVGCAEQRMEARRDVKIAALSKYPGNAKKSDKVQVTAVDYPDQKRLELLNTSDVPLPTPTVWVNQTFLNKAPTIPARGSVTIKYVDLIEQGQGLQDLAASGRGASVVEIETPEGLFSTSGPAKK